MNWIKNNINWLFLIGVILTFASPFLFTRHGFDWLDFTDTGGIGSTIGGITTPFVGLITITLLFLTLKEQLNFNINQQKSNDLNVIFQLKARIEEIFNKITIQCNHKEEYIITLNELNKADEFGLNSDQDFTIDNSTYLKALSQINELYSHVILFYELVDKSHIDKMIKKSLFNSIDNTARQILYFYVISINKRFIYNQAFEETIEYGEKTDDVIEVNNLANGEKILELENWNKIINKL